MPEGNVIHGHARRLNSIFKGSRVTVDSPQGRFDGRTVNGRTLVRAQAHGKHLFLDFDNEQTVHVHLGLFGKWVIEKGDAPAERGAIRLRLRNDTGFAELRGPTVCEVLDEAERDRVIERVGADPIKRGTSVDPVWQRVSKSRAPIGSLLMNQQLFAGVGNIYRAEVLFRAGISPYRTGANVSRDEFDGIWNDLVVLMRQGTKRGRIDTVRTEHLPDVTGRAAREDRHGGEVYVYRRHGQDCIVCGTAVMKATMQGRNLYWCPTCQVA